MAAPRRIPHPRRPHPRDTWWIEVDQDTENLPRLRAKLRTYTDYLHHGGTGPHGGTPQVLFTTPTPHRCTTIGDLITGLPPPAKDTFTVVMHHHAANHLIAALHDQ